LSVDLDVKDFDLQRYLDRAEAALNPVRYYTAGERLQATESVFLLDGLIKMGEANMIVGQPKVGKSSFSTGLIAALRDKRQQFLGRDLMLPGERMPVLVFGTDQSEGDWLHFLRREDLVTEDTQELNGLDFFCSMEAGQEYNFTRDGLKAMREQIEKHQFPLVVIDSLSSMMEPTGIEENSSRFAQPIRQAINQLRKTGATLLIIHHSVKRPNTWDWITECRGSSSISSVFSWGILMRWVAQEDEGLARTDKRVGFTGKGRGSGETGGVMAEYLKDGGWTYLDGLEAAQQAERSLQKIMELGGVRALVFDVLTQRDEMNVDISPDEIATELNKQRSAVNRELRALRGKGLALIAREEQVAGARRPTRFWELSPSAKAAVSDFPLRGSERGFLVPDVSLSEKNLKNMNYNSQDSMNVLEPETKETPAIRTRVERLIGDRWEAGWLVYDNHHPDSITIEKLGNVNLRIKNMRWGMDLRPESTVVEPSLDW